MTAVHSWRCIFQRECRAPLTHCGCVFGMKMVRSKPTPPPHPTILRALTTTLTASLSSPPGSPQEVGVTHRGTSLAHRHTWFGLYSLKSFLNHSPVSQPRGWSRRGGGAEDGSAAPPGLSPSLSEKAGSSHPTRCAPPENRRSLSGDGQGHSTLGTRASRRLQPRHASCHSQTQNLQLARLSISTQNPIS